MIEQMKRVEEASQKLAELQKECADLEASALAHEAKAREDRRARAQKKQDMESISIVLRNAQVALNIETAEQKARKAQAEAEKTNAEAQAVLASNVEKQKQLDEMLATIKAQAEKVEPRPE